MVEIYHNYGYSLVVVPIGTPENRKHFILDYIYEAEYKNMEMRIAYSTMIVGNMEESVKFYTEIMGFEVDSSYAPKAGSKITLLKGRGETMLELIEDSSYPVGLYSVGMDVKNLDLMVEKMRSEGAEIMTEITPTLVGRMAMIKDPSGIRYALIEHSV